LLVIVVALVVGVILIIKGSQSHDPAAAPLRSTTFAVKPGQLTPMALPPLAPGQPVTVSGDAAAGCTIPMQPAHVVIGSLCMSGPIVTTSATPEGALIIPQDVRQIGL